MDSAKLSARSRQPRHDRTFLTSEANFIEHARAALDPERYVTVMCDSLATDVRYTSKFVYLYEPDQYVLWRGYDHDLIAEYLRGRCAAWLD